jgi:hypothetical protein
VLTAMPIPRPRGLQPPKPTSPEEEDDGPPDATGAPPSLLAQQRQRRPAGLRPAVVNGPHGSILFVECRADGVILHPAGTRIAAADLGTNASSPLTRAVQQYLARRQAIRPGEPERVEVRFLVRGDALRTYHRAYPLLAGLPVVQKRQNLDPADDIRAIMLAATP